MKYFLKSWIVQESTRILGTTGHTLSIGLWWSLTFLNPIYLWKLWRQWSMMRNQFNLIIYKLGMSPQYSERFWKMSWNDLIHHSDWGEDISLQIIPWHNFPKKFSRWKNKRKSLFIFICIFILFDTDISIKNIFDILICYCPWKYIICIKWIWRDKLVSIVLATLSWGE